MLFNPYDDFETAPWPLVVKLKPDELLTSWITRLSYSHLLKVHTFCNVNFRGVQVWNRDFDRCVPDSVLKILSQKTLTPIERVKESTLVSYETYLFDHCRIDTNTDWIMPLQIAHRVRKRCALLYCPKCLKADKAEPYYRRKWRLSLSVVCPQCKCYLHEKCHACSSPVNFHRIELGRREQIPYFPLTTCYKCLSDLRTAPVVRAPAALLKMQEKLYQFLDSGYCLEYQCQYSHLFFSALRQIVKLLCSKVEVFERLNRGVCEEMGIEFTPSVGGYAGNFDMLSLADRSLILKKAMWLLDDWPGRFIRLTRASKVWSANLLKDFEDAPYWFWKEVKFNNHLVYSEWKKQLAGYPKYSSYNNFIGSRIKTHSRVKKTAN